jgi:hypothetical protein
MIASGYIVLKRFKMAGTTKKSANSQVRILCVVLSKPKLEPDEIAVRIEIDVPDAAFSDVPRVVIKMDAPSTPALRAKAEWDF